jgi:phosphoribosylformylglycinamidine synthase
MVGLVHDLAQVCGQAWRAAGDAIWLLGAGLESGAAPADPRLGLAGSSYLERIHGAVTGRPPEIDLALERSVQGFLRRAITQGLVASAHDLSDGGLAVAAAECCIATAAAAGAPQPLGATLELPASSARLDRLLFAEGGARILVSVPADQAAAWQQALDGAQAAAPGSVPAHCLGVVTAPGSAAAELLIRQAGQAQPLLQLAVDQLGETFEQAIPRRMGVDLPPTL